MPTVTRRTGTKRQPKETTSPNSIVTWFKQFLVVQNDAKQKADRAEQLKTRLKNGLAEVGEEDDKGHRWFDLPTPVEFKDFKGKVFKYTSLKRERRLTPAQPTPDPDKAEALLKEKGLWLTKAQEKTIRDLQTALPNVSISVEVDVDAVAALYYKDVLTEEEYDSILVEQRESFAFIPSES